jgi:hypothetical protein
MSDSTPVRRPTVWSLVSSIGLVVLGPYLLLAVIGIFTGSFALGEVELTLIWLVWVVGTVLVVRSWLRRRRAAGPSSA